MNFDEEITMLLRKADYILKEHEKVIKELKLKSGTNNTSENNNGWISVNDRLPNKAGSYLVIGKSGGATVTRWYMPNKYNPEGHFGGNGADYIRYWMPRPEPPKECENNGYIEETLIYIQGYCNKHIECEPYCKLYNRETNHCFLCDGSIPADWVIIKEGEKNE